LGDDVKVFPNPFENHVGVRIDAAEAGPLTLQLFDLQGRIVTEQHLVLKAGAAYYELNNLDGLAGGIYFVRVNMHGASKTIKVTRSN
jgi:hypothetical protein